MEKGAAQDRSAKRKQKLQCGTGEVRGQPRACIQASTMNLSWLVGVAVRSLSTSCCSFLNLSTCCRACGVKGGPGARQGPSWTVREGR